MSSLARRRVGDVRIPFALTASVVMAALFVAVMLFRARRFMFFSDEWDFLLESPRWHLLDYFTPHNEHWSTIPRLYYRLVLAAAGVQSYVPYEAGVLVMDAGCAILLFLIVRRRAGDLLGLIAAAMLLGLGRGWEDVLWAFQIGFVGSATLGLTAIYLLDFPEPGKRRLALASAALVVSLLFSGMALFYLLLVFLELGLDAARRRSLVVLAAPALIYAAWYLKFGHVGTAGDHLSLHGLLALDVYVPYGVGTAVAGLFGLSPAWAWEGVAGLSVILGAAVAAAGRLDSRLVAPALALVGQYAFTGLVRAQFGVEQATASRYIFIGAIFVLLVLTRAVTLLPAGRLALLLVLGVALVGLGNSLRFFNNQVRAWDVAAAQQVAAMQATSDLEGAPDLTGDAVFIPWRMPDVSATRYYEGVRRIGTAVPRASLEEVSARQPETFDSVLEALFKGAVRAGPPGTAGAGPCTPLDPSRGYSDATVPPSGGLDVLSELDAAPVQLTLWAASGPAGTPTATLRLPRGRSTIHLPDTGGRVAWHVRVAAPAAYVSVCSSGR